MTGSDLKQARLAKDWTQQHAARQFGVSQAYLSLLEKGRRPVNSQLEQKFLKKYEVAPTSLPLHSLEGSKPSNAEAWAHSLGSLGYPGFSYWKVRPVQNPAEVLLAALREPDLDSRVAKGLPWLAAKYPDMNWNWLVENAKLHDLQNRLGFTVTLARQVVEKPGSQKKSSELAVQENLLERSRLVREDTYCHDSLTDVEKRWLRENRSPEAQHWNLLTDLTAQQLMHDA